jgi:hypothetical protein
MRPCTAATTAASMVRLEQGLPQQFDAMVRQIAVDDAETLYIAAGHSCS